MVDTKILDAAQAYGETLKRNSGITPGGPGGTDAASDGLSGSNFADFLSDAVDGTMDAAKNSEKVALQAAGNQAEIVDVIAAVTNADITLQTIVAVRDKVISAYQDVMRMPI